MTDPLNIHSHCKAMLIEQIMLFKLDLRNPVGRAFLEKLPCETLSEVWQGLMAETLHQETDCLQTK